jgi:hypothetical protein
LSSVESKLTRVRQRSVNVKNHRLDPSKDGGLVQ